MLLQFLFGFGFGLIFPGMFVLGCLLLLPPRTSPAWSSWQRPFFFTTWLVCGLMMALLFFVH